MCSKIRSIGVFKQLVRRDLNVIEASSLWDFRISETAVLGIGSIQSNHETSIFGATQPL